MIFRNWTVGAYKIGDLMWNASTFHKAFGHVNSDHFILSLKYGDTDFFDHLQLSPFFRDTRFKKIIELQTRRERELFGIVPYYTGYQYETYQKQIKANPSVIGISVWCNTGGWSKWHNLTFLKNSSVWNELNTISTLNIFKHDDTAETALFNFFKDPRKVNFTKRATRLVNSILYIQDFAEQTLYFRRLRLPPLLWIFWDHVIINHLVVIFHKHFGAEKFEIPYAELEWFQTEGEALGFKDMQFQYKLLLNLAYCRKALASGRMKSTHWDYVKTFERTHKLAPKFDISFAHSIHYNKMNMLLNSFLRKHAAYRIPDYLIRSRPVSYILRVIYRNQIKNLPSFVNKQGMGFDSILK
ncbi:MAG: hypothetical protein U5R06_13640 [candidate division KSB1 bacterium]|nr:hypothetical protein [candidate division KSB1 bacterium]